MQISFSLIDQPWIGCTFKDGRREKLGIRAVLAGAHDVRDIWGDSPTQTAAIYRLLLAVLHRCLGPADTDVWRVLWQNGRWNMAQINPYLDRWQERFDLFHPQYPFYQTGEADTKEKGIHHLIPEYASGANPLWRFKYCTYDDEPPSLPPDQVARALIAIQAYGHSGLSGCGPNFTYGPCVRGILFLVTGESLFETLALNLLPYPDDRVMPIVERDRPLWELDAQNLDDHPPISYLSYLTWPNRSVRLAPEIQGDEIVVRWMTIRKGMGLDSSILDPMMAYRARDGEPKVVRFSPTRALWQDSAVIFQTGDDGKTRPPLALRWMSELIDAGHFRPTQRIGVMALGARVIQAKYYFYRWEYLEFPPAYITSSALRANLVTAMAAARAVRRQLWGATSALSAYLLSPMHDSEDTLAPAKDAVRGLVDTLGMESRFWSGLQGPFNRLLHTLPSDPAALDVWNDELRRAAWRSLSGITGSLAGNRRSFKASARARAQLGAGLRKVLDSDQSKEVK